MILTVRDDCFRYRIRCPDRHEAKKANDGCDYLIVPTAQGELWLFDALLLEAADSGEFGLQLLSKESL